MPYATQFLTRMQRKLPELQYTWDDLKTMPAERRDATMLKRREIVRVLCHRVYAWPDRRVDQGIAG